jgi:hypothetical protein
MDPSTNVGGSSLLSSTGGRLTTVNGGVSITKYSISDIVGQYVVNKNTNNYQISHPPAVANIQTSLSSNVLTVTITPPTYTGGIPIRFYDCVTNGVRRTLSDNTLSYTVGNVSSAYVSVTAQNSYGTSPAAFGGTAPSVGPTITSVGRDPVNGNLVVTYTKPSGYYYPATPTNFYYQLDTSAPNLFTDIGNTGSFSVTASAGKHDVYMICTYTSNNTAVWTSPASKSMEAQYVTPPSTNLAYVSANGATITQSAQYTLYEFSSNGNITFPNDTIAPLLVVGGGGGGSAVTYVPGTSTPFADVGGGGGAAGQMIFGNVGFRAGTYTVVVGSGGSPNNNGTFSCIYGTGVNVVANGGNAGGSEGALTATQSLGAAGGNTPSAVVAATGLLDYVALANNGDAGSLVTTGTAGGCGGGGGGAGSTGGAASGSVRGGTAASGYTWPVNNVTYAYGGAGGGGDGGYGTNGGGNAAGNRTFVGGTATLAGSGGGGGKTIVPTNVIIGGSGSGGSGANGVVIVAIPKNVYNFNGLNLTQSSGTVMGYLGTSDPPGWVICDGSPRTATDGRYNMLLAMGIGSGTPNSYTPPDYRGAFLRGTGTSPVNASYVGPALNASQLDSMDSHTHVLTDPGHTHVLDIRTAGGQQTQSKLVGYSWDNLNTTFMVGPGTYYGSSIMTEVNRTSVRGATTGITLGSTGGTETRPFNYGVNWILKI